MMLVVSGLMRVFMSFLALADIFYSLYNNTVA